MRTYALYAKSPWVGWLLGTLATVRIAVPYLRKCHHQQCNLKAYDLLDDRNVDHDFYGGYMSVFTTSSMSVAMLLETLTMPR